MKEQYLSFGKHIRTLLPDGERNMEVTVPSRLTRLFLVSYGIHDGDRMMIILTDTMLRLDHLSAMTLHDIEFLGKIRPDDKPTAMTTVFSCYWEDAGHPQGHGDIELDQQTIRKAARQPLEGTSPLKVTVVQTEQPLTLCERSEPNLRIETVAPSRSVEPVSGLFDFCSSLAYRR